MKVLYGTSERAKGETDKRLLSNGRPAQRQLRLPRLRVGEKLQQALGSLPRHAEPFLQLIEDEGMTGLGGLDEGHLGLAVGLLESLTAGAILDASDERSRLIEKSANLADSLLHELALRWIVGPRRPLAPAVTLLALSGETLRGEKPRPDLAMAGRAGGTALASGAQQLVVFALLKLGQRPEMAVAAGARQVAVMHRTGRIVTVQDSLVGAKRLEGGGVSAMALLTADVVARVRGVIPVVDVRATRSIRIGEVAVGASAFLRERG